MAFIFWFEQLLFNKVGFTDSETNFTKYAYYANPSAHQIGLILGSSVYQAKWSLQVLEPSVAHQELNPKNKVSYWKKIK